MIVQPSVCHTHIATKKFHRRETHPVERNILDATSASDAYSINGGA